MKILHLSTGDQKGAFSGAYRVHSCLSGCDGVKSIMFVANKISSDTSVYTISKLQKLYLKVLAVCWKVLVRLFISKGNKEYYFLNDFFSASTSSLKREFGQGYFDYIFIYYTSNFLSQKVINELAKFYSAELVFYPMDMGPFTGGCHYSWGCEGYTNNGCASCEIAKSPFGKKLINYVFYQRKNSINLEQARVFCGSQLLYDQVSQSLIFRQSKKSKVLLPINESMYSPKYRDDTRGKYGFHTDDIVILSGAQSLKDPRKGFDFLLDALCKLDKWLNEKGNLGTVVFLTVGAPFSRKLSFKNIKLKHIDYIDNEIEFSKLYASADLFVNPSIEDSGPMMVNEAILSGTPVVAFKTGVALDLVEESITGFFAKSKDAQSLFESISKFVALQPSKKYLIRSKTREKGMDMTSTTSQSEKILSLLKSG